MPEVNPSHAAFPAGRTPPAPSVAPGASRRRFLWWVGGAAVFGAGAGGGGWAAQRLFRSSGSNRDDAVPTPAEEFDQSLAELRKTDPALIKYQEAARIDTGFQRPRGVALASDGRVVVAGDRAVRVFNANGNRAADIAFDDNPRCVALGGDGTLYVGLRDRIAVFDRLPTGAAPTTPRATWPAPTPASLLTSLAVLGDALYAADARAKTIARYDAAGKVTAQIGRKDPDRNIPGFILPSPYLDLAPAASPTGSVLWVNNPGMHRVEAYAPDGDLVRSWGTPSSNIAGFCGCCNPTHVARLPDGRFVTSEKGLPRVKVYDGQGQFVGVVAGCEEFAPTVTGLDLAADEHGRVYVVDPGTRSVRVFEERRA